MLAARRWGPLLSLLVAAHGSTLQLRRGRVRRWSDVCGGGGAGENSRCLRAPVPVHPNAPYFVEYMAPITVGAQEFTLQIDTGSSLLAVIGGNISCASCPFYTSGSPLSSGVKSSSTGCQSSLATYAPSCGFEVRYYDSTHISGVLHDDVAAIGGVVSSMRFGRILSQSAAFEQDLSSGIMGLARDSLSNAFGRSPMQSAVLAGTGDGLSFCLSDTGGAMVLGRRAPVAWTRGPTAELALVDNGYYSARFSGIRLRSAQTGRTFETGVSGSDLGGADGGVLDTGTTGVLLPPSAYAKLSSALKDDFSFLPGVGTPRETCGGRQALVFDAAVRLDPGDVARYPVLLFSAPATSGTEAVLELPPAQYLVERGCRGHYALGLVSAAPQSAAPAKLLLGDVFLRAFTVEVDRSEGKVRIWQQGNCSAASGVVGEPFGGRALFSLFLYLAIAIASALILLLGVTIWRLRRARLSYLGARLLPTGDGSSSWDGLAAMAPTADYQSLAADAASPMGIGQSRKGSSGSASSFSEQLMVMNEGTL